MKIYNQDRDICLEFYGDETLFTLPVIFIDKCYGINLFISLGLKQQILLGTFDTVIEAAVEINKIQNCTDEIYFISQY